jgi:RNA polymerase sigma-70 factor (ECF subfamily)
MQGQGQEREQRQGEESDGMLDVDARSSALPGPGAGAHVARDAGLVDAARGGDVAAFARLFDQYQAPITGYLCRLTGNRDVADDLAQETFIKAFRALPRTDGDLLFRPWLYRIATNTANSWHRRRRLLTWIPLPLPSFGGSDHERGETELGADPRLDELAGEAEQVHAALREVGPRHASILLLRHHQRLTIAEIATTLEIPENTAKVRLFRARKAFIDAWSALDAVPTPQPDANRSDRGTRR